jgi:hypothetical protein
MLRCGALLAIVVAVLAPNAAAQGIRLTPESENGAIIVEFEAPSDVTQYVQVYVYPQTSDETLGDRLNGRTAGLLTNHPGEDETYFSAQRIVAGEMRLGDASISAQPFLHFHVCYADRADFDVRPGEVIFLGRVRTDQVRASAAPFEGRVRPRQRVNLYVSVPGAGGLPLTPPSDLPGWEDRVNAYVRQYHPNVTAPVRAAEYRSVSGQCVPQDENRSWLTWMPKD